MSYSFGIGSRGYIVEALQQKLRIKIDGDYGAVTAGTVANLQKAENLEATGRADALLFALLGMKWPDEFQRAMNLVCNFEGTSFGDCNLDDIDGAGLTWGIAGFTTEHGEVQTLLAEYLKIYPGAVEDLPAALKSKLNELRNNGGTRREWRALFYGESDRVLKIWRDVLRLWGRCPIMQMTQLTLARELYWKPALITADSLGFKSLQARCFYLDVAVQNGGWRKSHHVLANRLVDWHSGIEPLALAAAARAVAASSKEKWRNDVLARKMAIATGRGVVHGQEWFLESHGF